MNINAFIWLHKNLNRYEYASEEAIKVKNDIAGISLNDENINNEEFLTKAEDLYESFIHLFYNNILGYRKGLADKPITARELDCYFVRTNYGTFALGSYRTSSTETVKAVIENYINGCKKSLPEDTVETLADKYIKDADEKMNIVINSGKSSTINAILVELFSCVLIAVSFVLMSGIDVADVLFGSESAREALKDIPFLYNIGNIGWGVAFFVAIVGIILGICGILKTTIAFVFLMKRAKAQNAIDKAVAVLEDFEDIELMKKSLMHSMLSGKRTIIKTEKEVSEEIAGILKDTNGFVSGPPGKHVGISYVFVFLLAIMSIIMILPYSSILADVTENVFEGYDEEYYEEIADDKEAVEDDKEAVEKEVILEEEAEDIPKVSEYYVFKSDCTWLEASAEAEYLGGYLVSINNRDEFEKVCALADQKDINVFWVGIKRRPNMEWYEASWQDGSNLVFTNWLQGEPTYYSEEGDFECYLMVFKVGNHWYYNDAPYDVTEYYKGKIGYIVEIEE